MRPHVKYSRYVRISINHIENLMRLLCHIDIKAAKENAECHSAQSEFVGKRAMNLRRRLFGK